MARYLVTGGCGFIGSHLCDWLTQHGHGVRVLDDLSAGKRENLPPGAEFIHGSINDLPVLHRAMAGMDGCFHLAAIPSVELGMTQWLATHHVNLTGTIAVFDAASRLPAPIPVVYASSAAVYGDTPVLPIVETAQKRPLSAYGADKYACELHAVVATEVHGVPTTGLRFFNVYGPRQDPKSPYSGVISIFCDRLRARMPVTIYGDGGQTRDFIFVGDVVTGLIQAMERRVPEARVFNLCTGRATPVLTLAQTIADLCGMQADIRFGPARAGEIRHSVGSSALGHDALNLPEPVTLRVGLQPVLDWLEAADHRCLTV
jgi:UDP-glucose 4-epimerase